MLLLLAALLLSRHIDPEKQRYQQHLSYNTQVEDTSLSIDEDTFSSHLPVVSIETGGGGGYSRPAGAGAACKRY